MAWPWVRDHGLMTLLGVLTTDQAVYMAADAGERYADQASGQDCMYHVPRFKVERLGSRAVLWAYFGNGERGDALARWLRSQAESLPNEWPKVIAALSHQWQEVSIRQEWQRLAPVGALIVGWLGGIQKGYLLPLGTAGSEVSFSMMGSPSPYFSGVGNVAAKVAFESAKATDPNGDEIRHFETAMDTTIRNVDYLWAANRNAAEPVSLIRMNKNGSVDELRGKLGGPTGKVAD